MKRRTLLTAVFAALASSGASALNAGEQLLPTPSTVSPELAWRIEKSPASAFANEPKTAEELIALREKVATGTERILPGLFKKLGLTVRERRLGSVRAWDIVPSAIPAARAGRILLHIHGGGYTLNPGISGTYEAACMAGIAGFRIVSIDYRMPPEHPFPAALDDALEACRELLKIYLPHEIGVFGTSDGGGLTFALLLSIKELGLPMPGAAVAGTPWGDLTKTGDSLFTNDHVDNVLVKYEGKLEDAAKLYAAGRDLRDPLISPVYGDLTGLPPCFSPPGPATFSFPSRRLWRGSSAARA